MVLGNFISSFIFLLESPKINPIGYDRFNGSFPLAKTLCSVRIKSDTPRNLFIFLELLQSYQA